jgi:integrase
MARRARGAGLEARSSRLKLPVAKKPVFVKIGPGLGLGYRRNATAGTWVVRVADGKGANWTKAIGSADDFEDSNCNTVLDFWQAQDRARAVARGGRAYDDYDGKPITINKALDQYEANLKVRGADIGNVTRVRAHLSESLARKSVALATARDFRTWRDDLAANIAPATVNRIRTGLRAALNLLADHDDTIANRRAWEMGLAAIRGANEARNVILSEPVIRSIINAAEEESREFQLVVEVSAVTGARFSQIARLEIQDLQDDGLAPRLMMPASRKGGGVKKITRRPVPIPVGLAARLRAAANTRSAGSPLLLKGDREPWRKGNHRLPFMRTVRRAGLNPAEVTIYALRHSNIVRQLLAGVPVRVVAVNHDTSVTQIERTYSRHIGDHADALARRALLDVSDDQPGEKVVPITAAR